MSELRQVHLRGATSAASTQRLDGREYLVVPVVALMDGVIHAVNAKTPERVTVATLEKAAHTWNGKPLTLGHPVRDGRQCSANDPKIIEAQSFGFIANSHVKGQKMLQHAWCDVAKLEMLGQHELLKRLREEKMCEVSVGAFVVTDAVAGEHNGKAFKATWLEGEVSGDHLAFLPNGIGACSIEMGCGAHRAAECVHLVTAEGFEFAKAAGVYATIDQHPVSEHHDIHAGGRTRTYLSKDRTKMKGLSVSEDVELFDQFRAAIGKRNNATDQQMIQTVHDHAASLGAECDSQNVRFMSAIKTLQGESLDARLQAVRRAVEKEYSNGNALVSPSSTYAYPQTVYDDHVIIQKGDKLFSVDYATGADGEVEFTSDPVEVKQEYIAASSYTECATCNGTGQISKDGKQSDCSACAGEGTMKAAAALPQLKAACGCQGESTMDKKAKAELIAALVTDKHSGFKEGDEPFLETASDARLDEFKAAAATNKTAAEAAVKNENDLRAAQAKLTVVETKLKTAEAAPTDAEWLDRAPAGIKTLLENQKAAEDELREGLIGKLKGLKANTEEELKAMPTAALKQLAAYAKVDQPVNYAGRGVAVPRDAQNADDYTPPDPYAPGIKALQAEGSKAVN